MGRVNTWLAQREEIAGELRRAADSLMSGDNPLAGLMGGDAGASAGNGRRKRKPMSAEARAKIAEAQKKRWAAQKGSGKKSKAAKDE